MPSPLRLTELRCEYRANPLGIDILQPRLSWQLDAAGRRGVSQSAYQILVASTPEKLAADQADVWNSGRVESPASIQIVYGGPAPQSRTRSWWKVRVWEAAPATEPSVWSEPAWWEMGLLDAAEWSPARWIGSPLAGSPTVGSPAPYLRRDFTLGQAVASARLYVTALGLYEFYFNGSRVGDDVFRPGWTEYRKRLQYDVYDVTALLRAGANAAGAILGDGWYCGRVGPANRQGYGDRPKLLALLRVTFADGTTEAVATGPDWQTAVGPVLEDDFLAGESFDNRRRFAGGDGSAECWSAPGFDGSEWGRVLLFDGPPGRLVASRGQPVRRTVELPEAKRSTAPTSHWGYQGHLIDMGQNMVGWVRLKVRGERGTTIRLRFTEMLDKDGKPYTENLRGARATDFYTCAGDGEETWEPRFTFHGFRYVEVMSREEFTLPPDGVTGIVLHSDTPPTGEFECSDPLINQLQHNIQWGQRGNFLEVPTDCPQRDERLGWTGDAQVFIRTAAFNMDVAPFFTKWQGDIDDAQAVNGNIPAVVPRMWEGDGGAAWEDAAIICPWTVYLCYGDTRLLAEHYASLQKFIGYLEKTSRGNVRGAERGWVAGKVAKDFDDPASGEQTVHAGHGDWLALDGSGKTDGGTPKDLIGTAFFAHSTGLLGRIARVLGKTGDAERYERRFEEIRATFQHEFVTPGGRVLGGTQTSYVLGLQFDLLPESARSAAADALVRDITARGMHLSTGFVGTPYLPHVLTAAGHLDTAYALLNQKTWPSWLYAVTQGATTIWERWDGWTHDRGFQTPDMNSYNHYAYGAIGEWLYSNVAGIDLDPAQPAYKHIVIHPRPGGGLTHAKASLRSAHGLIESGWRLEDGVFRLDVTIPANTTATVHLPAADPGAARENAQALDKMAGLLEPPRAEGGAAVFTVGSGQYHFTAPAQPAA